jgi:hypothetical protein
MKTFVDGGKKGLPPTAPKTKILRALGSDGAKEKRKKDRTSLYVKQPKLSMMA